ncbi:MAG: T9SS type A sorting domain-containing protein [Flavobacterium sp.]|nr:T9SS type A sorting domain-containing protein [Flavobacterium sp.]
MNRKITLLSLKCLVLIGFTQVLSAQQIYTNGPLSTGATSASGVAAPAGYTWSEVQSDAGNTTESNTNAGISGYYVNSLATNFALADDFTVPADVTWNITSFDFYCYQTNYAGVTPPIDVLRIQIYNGDPSAGGTAVAGDLTTNVYDDSESAEAMMYRTFNTVTPSPGTAPGTTRKIWRVRGNITASLAPGTYWIVYQGHAVSDTAFFWPTATVVGSRTLSGWNAKQLNVTTSAWTTIVDGGNPATAPDVQQDFPFDINGTVLGVNQNDFDAQVTLSPNPVKDILTISVPTNVVVKSATIYDLNGKLVQQVNESTSVNVSQLAVGNYVLKVTSDSGEVAKKFIKE